VYLGTIPVGKADFFETMPENMPYQNRFKNIITFYYMANINQNHRKLKSLIEIARLFKNTKTKVIFYASPVDYQAGEKYYPGVFKKRISENINLISSYLKKEGCRVIDLSFVLKSSNFNWHELNEQHRYVNEHINYFGRDFIANSISKVIMSKNN
jgi:hypothetical protein